MRIAKWKIELVNRLRDEIVKSRVVGVVGIRGIPSTQMMRIRKSLRGKAKLIVARNNLIKRALEEAAKDKKEINRLVNHVADQCGLIFTDNDAFDLYSFINKTKTKAPAKGGEKAPEDIIIYEGPTPFKPGPIVGELQKAGIPAAIEGGKIVIKKTITYVKAGEVITPEKAGALAKLGINPITVGLELRAAYEDGVIYSTDVLAIDIDAYEKSVISCASSAFNLAMNIGYVCRETAEPLIAIAHQRAMNLAMNANIITPETVDRIIAKAYSQMLALAAQIPDALDDELRALAHAKGADAPQVEAKEEAKKDEEEKKKAEEKKVSEEEAAAGLSALFG